MSQDTLYVYIFLSLFLSNEHDYWCTAVSVDWLAKTSPSSRPNTNERALIAAKCAHKQRDETAGYNASRRIN